MQKYFDQKPSKNQSQNFFDIKFEISGKFHVEWYGRIFFRGNFRLHDFSRCIFSYFGVFSMFQKLNCNTNHLKHHFSMISIIFHHIQAYKNDLKKNEFFTFSTLSSSVTLKNPYRASIPSSSYILGTETFSGRRALRSQYVPF